MKDGLMSRNGVDMDERMRGKRIGGGLGEIAVNGATKGFPGFLRVRPNIRSQSNQDSQLFNGERTGQTSDSCSLFSSSSIFRRRGLRLRPSRLSPFELDPSARPG